MISIIYPTLNEEGVIGDTVQALKSKLTLPHEVIVSDGKSTDKTAEVARKYADKVVEYSGTKRQTIAQGRNDGAKAAVADTDYFVFMDADTRILNPDLFFKRAFEHFERDPKLVALTVRMKVVPENETLADKIIFTIFSLNLRFLNNVMHRGESMGEFQMIKRSAFLELNGFREDLVTREDADMFLRLAKIGHTRMDYGMVIYHSGRRAHKIGWPKLLKEWITNTIWVVLFDKAHSKEWTVVR